jgi:prepilin-type N-terminal cleavage/methylation domain-containing protein
MRRPKRAGFTLPELLVVCAAMGLVMAAGYSVFATILSVYVNGVSAARTGMAMRAVYDKMALDIMQSPGRFGSAMSINTTSPATLVEANNTPSEALALGRVVAGPLQVKGLASDTFSAATLRIPPQVTTAGSSGDYRTTTYSLAGQFANNIQVGDYLKIVVGDAMEARITAVSYNSSTKEWSITCDTYNITFSTNKTSFKDYENAAAFIIRYSAYVVLKDVSLYGRTYDCLAYYDNLQVNSRRGNMAYNPPSAFNLPSNYATSYTELITTDVAPSATAEAAVTGSQLKPFTTVIGAAHPMVDIKLGLEASEYDKINAKRPFYTTAELIIQVPLKSNGL